MEAMKSNKVDGKNGKLSKEETNQIAEQYAD